MRKRCKTKDNPKKTCPKKSDVHKIVMYIAYGM